MSRDGVFVHTMIQGGLPAKTILRTDQDPQHDLIIMGTHGRRGFAHLISGSVAEAVLRRSPCPVLTVKKFHNSMKSKEQDE